MQGHSQQKSTLLEEVWAGTGHYTGVTSLHGFLRCLLTFVDV